MSVKNRENNILKLPIFVLFYLFPLNSCFKFNNITKFQSLSQVNTIVSPSQIFELGFFSPNQSSNQYVGIWYTRMSPRTVIWVANRESPLNITDSRATLTIGIDGNLKIMDRNNNSVWSTNVQFPSNNSVGILLDNGNFLLKDKNSGAELWQSFDHPGDTSLPGSVLGFDSKTNKSYTLTSWRSEIDPSLGNFVLGVSLQIPPEIFVWINGSIPLWRSGPWDKYKFSGVPDMDTSYWSNFNLVQENGTVFVQFKYFSSDDLVFVYISPKGILKLMDENGNFWETGWQAPARLCDLYGYCGPFGVCNDSASPICECLTGFEPKSNPDWRRGNWTQGCVRQKKLFGDCNERGSNNNNTSSLNSKVDRFEKLSNMKPPDFYELVEYNVSGCLTFCQMNCSCIAFAYIEGIGCLVWSEYLVDLRKFSAGGENIFLRLAYQESQSTEETTGGRNNNKKKIEIIMSIVSVLTCAIIGAIAISLYRQRKEGNNAVIKPSAATKREALGLSEHDDPTELPIFDFSTILIATNHFSQNNKLGQGGFGPVYKGKLTDGREIAVKRLSSSSSQGIEEFKNEMRLISKLQHRNLVKLFGYCIEDEEKLLVYEFMPNKSLDYLIFDRRKCKEIDWAIRWNIVHGISRGLVYLHRDSCLRVIHRDLKVSNILLDEKMNPKISDFGLARMFQGTLDLANTQRVVGTLGYMSPEYAMGGIFSEKSDVFSFGVLILEIVSGKKNTNFHYCDQQLSLIAYAWQLWSESRELELVDEVLLADSCSNSEVKRCIHIGLLCVQDHAADRPSMPEVVTMLSNETIRPKPKQPMFTLHRSSEGDFQSRCDANFSANEITMSLVEGR